MSREYEIPLVLRIRATDDAKAVRVAEYFMAATRRFNGADLSFAERRELPTVGSALSRVEARFG